MKAQTSSQSTEKQPHVPPANQHGTVAAGSTPTHQMRSSIDDLEGRIAIRAYELYVQRGWREGCSLEDWLDAERDILSSNVYSQPFTTPPQEMEA
jgi:hypothetical protein